MALGPDSLRLLDGASRVRHLAHANMIPGVAIDHVSGNNGPGVGSIRSASDGTTLSWRAPGSSTYGAGVDVSPADALYVLSDGEDTSKFVSVGVTRIYLIDVATEARVLLQGIYNNAIAHDDVTAGEATSGDVTSYTATLRALGSNVVTNIKVWLDAATTGIEISDDGVAWVAPTDESTALSFPDLAPFATDTLHLRRTIGAGASSDPEVLNVLHCAFDAL